MEMPPKEILLKLFRDLLTARRIEPERLARGRGDTVHSGIGEEAITIAIANNLKEKDCFHPNFRTLYCCFAKPGFTVADAFSMPVFSRGLARARGMKNNLWMAPEKGMLGVSGTLGEGAVRYVGAAVAASIKKTGVVTVFSQGDGASNRAPTHEAMAVAAAWQLPIVFVIHNNHYGMGTSVTKSYNIEDLSVRGLGYGMPSERVDGNDMIAMYQVARKHIDNCRAGGGPSLIAADTWRLGGHTIADKAAYRPKGEVEEWKKKDPLPRYQQQLIDMGILTGDDVLKMEVEIAAEIKACFE